MPTALIALLAPIAVHAPAPAVTPDDEGARIAQKVWDATLRTCGRSAFESLDGKTLIELEAPAFTLAPTKLTEAAKERGYQYQATAVATAKRWRWAPQTPNGAGRWSPWQEGANIDVRLDNFGIGRDHTLTENAVLSFEFTRKDGVWAISRPLSPLNSEIKPFDLKTASGPAAPPCSRLVARR